MERSNKVADWRRLGNEELHDLYSSSNIVRVITTRKKIEGHVVPRKNRREAYRILVGIPKEREY